MTRRTRNEYRFATGFAAIVGLVLGVVIWNTDIGRVSSMGNSGLSKNPSAITDIQLLPEDSTDASAAGPSRHSATTARSGSSRKSELAEREANSIPEQWLLSAADSLSVLEPIPVTEITSEPAHRSLEWSSSGVAAGPAGRTQASVARLTWPSGFGGLSAGGFPSAGVTENGSTDASETAHTSARGSRSTQVAADDPVPTARTSGARASTQAALFEEVAPVAAPFDAEFSPTLVTTFAPTPAPTVSSTSSPTPVPAPVFEDTYPILAGPVLGGSEDVVELMSTGILLPMALGQQGIAAEALFLTAAPLNRNPVLNPEPASLLLLGTGLGFIARRMRRRAS